MVLVPTHELFHDKQVVVEGGVAKAASTRAQHTSRSLQAGDELTPLHQSGHLKMFPHGFIDLVLWDKGG